MHQTILKYKKKLFNQVKKLKINFFSVPNIHLFSGNVATNNSWKDPKWKLQSGPLVVFRIFKVLIEAMQCRSSINLTPNQPTGCWAEKSTFSPCKTRWHAHIIEQWIRNFGTLFIHMPYALFGCLIFRIQFTLF